LRLPNPGSVTSPSSSSPPSRPPVRSAWVRAVAVATVVPFGAAGGAGDDEGPQRDYHDGPGLGQFVELKLGLRNLGLVRLNMRAIEIDGTLVGDAIEAVMITPPGAIVQVVPHHAIAAVVIYSARSARFDDVQMTGFDQSADVRDYLRRRVWRGE